MAEGTLRLRFKCYANVTHECNGGDEPQQEGVFQETGDWVRSGVRQALAKSLLLHLPAM